MSASLLTESPTPISAVAREIPGARGAKCVNPSTVWRWCTQGTRTPDGRRVRLEYYRIGSRVMTTREAVARFVAKLSAHETVDDTPTRTPSERRKADKRAEAELRAMGA